MKVYPSVVSTAYGIKDVADRSGFTPATLRYYEDIGLLPATARTPAGYRLNEGHRLTVAEQDCCQFFRLAITVDSRGIALEVRAPDEALPIVLSSSGAPR